LGMVLWEKRPGLEPGPEVCPAQTISLFLLENPCSRNFF
jgi:hypothetical protein